MKLIKLLLLFIILLSQNFLVNKINAQCILPLSITERASKATTIVLGHLKGQSCYREEGNQKQIFTANRIEVVAYLKGAMTNKEIVVLSRGGVVGNRFQVTMPSLHLDAAQDYVFFLEDDNTVSEDKTLRVQYPDLRQCFPYSDVQGAIAYQEGKYADVGMGEKAFSEKELLTEIARYTKGERPTTPDGTPYKARTAPPKGALRVAAITSFNMTTVVGGTTVASNELIINGSGFGATTGKVGFKNPDNGGTSYRIFPQSLDEALDIVSWSDTQIRLKVHAQAGTGQVKVYDNMNNLLATSVGDVTVNWALYDVYSDYSGFPSSTRQDYRFHDHNGIGGYSFVYNHTTGPAGGFAGDAAAKTNFFSTVNRWRCATGVNWDISTSTTTLLDADDAFNVVTYNALPAGVLGYCTFYGYGDAGATCTVWYPGNIDIAMAYPAPGGLTWNYTGNPTGAQVDFESVLTHELGHGHGLGHVIDASKIMHFSFGAGQVNTTLASADIAAGNHRMGLSSIYPCAIVASPPVSPMIGVPLGSCALLPIRLASFEGEKKEQGIALSWKTASEQNVRAFSVERSADGYTFRSIGEVAGKGNSTIEQHYSFLDQHPLNGSNYYRLVNLDYDGQSDNSRVIIVQNIKENASKFTFFQENNMLEISYFNQSTEKTTTFELFDMTGKRQAFFVLEPSTDEQLFANFDTSNLPAGCYVLRVQQGEAAESVRWVK